jgi:hypothetical protein
MITMKKGASGLRIFGCSAMRYNRNNDRLGGSIPQVTIRTGILGPDGREEQLTEYICDYPGCPNIPTRWLGCLPELRLRASVCDDHDPKHQTRTCFS